VEKFRPAVMGRAGHKKQDFDAAGKELTISERKTLCGKTKEE
jgi:hypothetical protein